MKTAHFISDQINEIFLGQRFQALKKFYKLINGKNKKFIECKNLIFFTWGKESISKVNNYNNLKNIIFIEVIHSGHLCASGIFSNKINFFFYHIKKKIKIYLKIILTLKNKKNFQNLNIIIKYVVVSSKINKNYILPIPKKLIIFCKPYYKNNYINNPKRQFLFKNNLSNNNFLFYFDSHFPLHPDSFSQNHNMLNKQLVNKMLNIYLDFLNRKLFNQYRNYKVIIFLHPRTYTNLKSIVLSKYIKKKLNKLNIYSGFEEFSYNFGNLTNKSFFIVQYGTQLSLIKSQYPNLKKNQIGLLELDDQFLFDFKSIKKSFKDYKNYLKNYELIEINPFKKADKIKFLKIS